MKGGNQNRRATLRREVHAVQEVLEARLGVQGIDKAAVPSGRVDCHRAKMLEKSRTFDLAHMRFPT